MRSRNPAGSEACRQLQALPQEFGNDPGHAPAPPETESINAFPESATDAPPLPHPSPGASGAVRRRRAATGAPSRGSGRRGAAVFQTLGEPHGPRVWNRSQTLGLRAQGRQGEAAGRANADSHSVQDPGGRGIL